MFHFNDNPRRYFSLFQVFTLNRGLGRGSIRLIFLGILLISLIGTSILISIISTVESDRLRQVGPLSYSYTSIIFTSSTSYSQALKMITNLGLQPAIICGTNPTPSEQNNILLWQTMGQKEIFLNEHRLSIVSSAYAPSDWVQRLHTSANVHTVKQIAYPLPPCPKSLIVTTKPALGVAIPLTGSESTVYIRIKFTYPLNTYDDSLYAISNIGLLLAAPCYKQIQVDAQGKDFSGTSKYSWHPMNQENMFNATHTLIVETVPLNTSTLWKSQLHAIHGVVSVEAPFKSPC